MTKYRRDMMLTDEDWEALRVIGMYILANDRFNEDAKASVTYHGKLSRSAVLHDLIERTLSANRIEVDLRQVPQRTPVPRRTRG